MKHVLLCALILSGCATQDMLKRAEQEGERLRFELARTYVNKGAYVAALPLAQKAAAEHPTDPAVLVLYATVLRERSLYLQSEHEFQAALEVAPNHAPAWAGLGLLYDLMERRDEAETAHKKAVTLSPRDAAYWNNLGFSRFIAGRTDEAIEAFERALGLDASMVVGYNNLGFAYAKKGDFANAKRCFRAALGPVSGDLNLALAYEQSGDSQKAEELRAQSRRADREARP